MWPPVGCTCVVFVGLLRKEGGNDEFDSMLLEG